MEIKLKDHDLHALKVLLMAIPRERLYWDEATFANNKFQALTMKNKLIRQINDANIAFIKVVEKVYAKRNELEQGLAIEKIEIEADKKAVAELTQSYNNEFDEYCKKEKIKYNLYADKFPIIKVNDPKEIEFELEDRHKLFLDEQFDKNIFNLPFDDEIISDIYEAIQTPTRAIKNQS